MEIIPPAGFLTMSDARDTLMRCMHRKVPPTEDIKAHRKEGLHVVDGSQATAAAKVLRQGIRNGDVALFALFSSRDTPMRLHDLGLIEAALFPSTSTVLTFIYCGRHAAAPFGLCWSDLKELTRDPLCLDEKQFGRWLRSEERKKAWPCHASKDQAHQLPGRPSLIDEVIEALEELIAKGDLSPTDPVKVMHARLRRARPLLREIAPETVRRARNQISYRAP
jgi:hypothetical protein